MIVMDDIETTFSAWVVYQGIYAHFTRDYDYFKFNGKIKFMVGQLANYDVIQFDFSAPFFKEKRNRNKGETMIISKSEGKVLLVKRNVDLFLI